ncbi:MAG TPA: bifunctional phosphoribosyl-AMP cyclohydrolase/phosphoribosyl-ATP diphosphatase HisIE [Gemmatimonadaceae bacterium]|jgi:phosphoribosyl-ATP pyrophosphohydrolase/phosphoribosyl-AMP cyclohydrolase|nr:bifunctional phosphoribosyl-AMP cyclohydrolase/phosphoribosyl-ATP diphosphatase HisIE [Gemmatimonadaceae bacterium]
MIDNLDFEKGNGLITVVAQNATTGAVLMVAHMDREALDKTVETGEMHYRSRTRGLWHKGATSGNVQRVVSLTPDCDRDTLLARVHPAGPACHTGAETCFGDALTVGDAVSALASTIESRVRSTGTTQGQLSYTQRLLADRNLRLKKLGEEMAELILAIADSDTGRAAEEGADVMYHTLVALRAVGVTLNDVRTILAARAAK